MATHTLLRALATITLLCVYVQATPLWLRPELRDDQKLSTNPRAEADYRLTEDVIPISYDVKLIPFFETPPAGKTNFTFDGEVLMTVDVKVVSKKIRMHAYDIKIAALADITVERVEVPPVPITPTDFTISSTDNHFFEINFADDLVLGQHTIKVIFTGVLNADLDGFYRSSYVEDGVTKWLGVTQFEQNGARRAFPCFDQSDLKARFTIHIAKSGDNNVLSNMPQAGEPEPIPELEGYSWVHFLPSVPMSTYLVAFTVTEFTSIDITDAFDGKLYKVWARPSAVHQGHYGNENAPKVIKFMEDYTKHEYTLPKMDQIAIPDFSAGAMENWGLVTYRETALLFEEGVSTSSNRQRIENVVAHELAHQWFGNLVSPTWWSHIWLNEGFATYYEYHAMDKIQPTWQLQQQFVYEEMHGVLVSDALESTHPLLTVVDTPASSSAAFDGIAYSKGGCIVRFMISLMGEEKFKEGINRYLENMKFQAADKDDLWRNLAESVDPSILPTGRTFTEVMDTWATQSGYPVIQVTRDYAQSMGAKITQERFLTLKTNGSVHDEKWDVPLTFTAGDMPDFEDMSQRLWHTGPEMTASNLAANNTWLIFNKQQFGYYRVNYDDKNWKMIASALHDETDKIHVINRAQVMDDSLALARAGGYVSYNLALDTTGYLVHEAEYMPWASALSALSYLNDRLNYVAGTRGPFEWYMLSRLGHVYEVVNGFLVTEDDSHVTRLKRSLILRWACQLGHVECNTEATAMFDEWTSMEDPHMNNPIVPDLKSVVYCAGARKRGQAGYDFLVQHYELSSNVASEQALVLTALGCSTDKTILQAYLEESIKPVSAIRSQDARTVFTAVHNNYLGTDIALDFLIANWETLQPLYSSLGSISRVFNGLAAKLNTQEQLDKLIKFKTDNPTTVGSSADGAIQSVEETLGWHKAHKNTVVNYFTNLRGAAGISSISPLLLVLTASLSVFFAKF